MKPHAVTCLIAAAFTPAGAITAQTLPALTGFAGCSSLAVVDRQNRLRDHLQRMEEFSGQFDEMQLNNWLGEDSERVAQLKLFAPYAFYQPRRVVGAWLVCHGELGLVVDAQATMDGVRVPVADWKACVFNLAEPDSAVGGIVSQLAGCFEAPKSATATGVEP